jgi:hypothetical protein
VAEVTPPAGEPPELLQPQQPAPPGHEGHH